VTDDVSKQEDETKDEKGSAEESAETVIDASKEATEKEIGVSEEGAADESEKGEEQSKKTAENINKVDIVRKTKINLDCKHSKQYL